MILNELTKTVLRLLIDGHYHSGSDLADQLAISRTTVWNQIQLLQRLGLEIHATSGKGYRIPRPLELLDAGLIREAMNPAARTLIAALEIHDIIDSTNTYLLDAVQHDPARGTACLAEMQTAGRGRLGRHWVSPFAGNIYLSLLWRYGGGPAVTAGLSLAIAVAVIRALESLGVDGLGLKWPNDILWEGRKLGGILVELRGDSCGPCVVVVGFGLNVTMPAGSADPISQPWVDLDEIMGAQRPARNRLAAALLEQLLDVVNGYEDRGLQPYLSQWRQHDFYRGKTVTLIAGNTEVAGRILGISDEGYLQLDPGTGEIRAFASGEVSFHQQSPAAMPPR